jgi:hypothetical protein
MFEHDAAGLRERKCGPDPDAARMVAAARRIGTGLDAIDNGLDWIADAIAHLNGTPMADRVQSVLDGMEALATELEGLKDRYERGERE